MNDEVMNKMVETMESFNARMAAMEERSNLEAQERAAHAQNNPARVEPTSVSLRDITDAMAEKRAITLSGAGNIVAVKELFKVAMQKAKIASRVKYFYGPNSSTNIPVLSPRPAAPAAQSEGATNINSDSTAALGVASITPAAYVSVLPVSYEAIKMGAANLDAELPTVFQEAFMAAIDNACLNGTNGAFNAVPTGNKITCGASGLPKLADVVKLAEAVVDLDIADPVIVISSTAHAALLAETGSVYDFVKEELARNGRILGVEVIVTGKAPSNTTAGKLTAWAGSLQNIGVGVAADLTIEPIKKVGDTNTYFQAIMAFAAKVIVPGSTFALVAA